MQAWSAAAARHRAGGFIRLLPKDLKLVSMDFCFSSPDLLKNHVPLNIVTKIAYFTHCMSIGLLLTNIDAIPALAEFFLFLILFSGNQMVYA